MRNKLTTLFRLYLGITGVCETLLGLSIVFLASVLQHFLETGALEEPLNFRILGMMDFYIGIGYVAIALNPEKHLLLNKVTCLMRLGLACLFLVEGLFLLHDSGLRLTYQLLAAFDLSLFVSQGLYIRSAARPKPLTRGANA